MRYRVKEYMIKDIVIIDGGASATEASQKMMEKDRGSLIVTKAGQPMGIVTERDLTRKVLATERNPVKVKVSEIMSSPLITIDPDASVREAAQLMAKHGVRRLPVIRDNIIYGLFTARVLAHHFNEYEDRLTTDLIRTLSHVSVPF